MPREMPTVVIKAPPTIGAMTIGNRFRIDCNVKPMARRSRGSESPMTAKTAGEAMLCQAMTSARATNSNGQDGLNK